MTNGATFEIDAALALRAIKTLTGLKVMLDRLKYDLQEIVGQLGAAETQRSPEDDQIIATHISVALVIARIALRDVENTMAKTGEDDD